MPNISFFKVNSCCCAIPLKTGSIVILILNLIFSLYQIGNDFTVGLHNGALIWHLVYLGVEILGLYGILKKKPNFILPHLVFHALFFVLLILSLVVMLFAKSWIEKMIHEQSDQSETMTGMRNPHENSTASLLDSMYLYVIVVCGIVLVLEYHFLIVVLSYFHELKVQRSTSLPPA